MAYTNMTNEQEYPPSQNPYPVVYPQPPPSNFGWKPPSEAINMPAQSAGSADVFIDPESLQPKNMAFTDESIRKGFIRKVYLILMGQLTFTFGVVAFFLLYPPMAGFANENPGLLISAALITLVVVIAMACCETARRTYPLNFICLSIFTLAESVMIGAVSSLYESEEVLMAVGITAILCLALSIFAMQTKYDFTACGGFILAALLVLMIFGMVAMFWRDHIVQTIYASFGALLSCVFLIYDTQLMMGGEHKYSISPEEYIFAALNLYIDVVRMFLYILQLIGQRK